MAEFNKNKKHRQGGKGRSVEKYSPDNRVTLFSEGQDAAKDRTVFVGNLPFKMKKSMLTDIFSQFGTVVFVKLISDRKTGEPKGFGFVEFEKSIEVETALKAPKKRLECFGRTLTVRRFNGKDKSKGKLSQKDVDPTSISFQKDKVTACQENIYIFSSEMLSDDDLILIFSYLSAIEKIKIERVCRRWQSCAQSAAKAQRRLTLVKEFKSFQMFSEDLFQEIMKRSSQNLNYLDISRVSTRFGNRSLSIIGKCCRNIEELNMTGVAADNDGMEELSSTCKNLRVVNASDCINLRDQAFSSLIRNCKKLESLHCAGIMSTVKGEFLRYAEPKMKCLDLAFCKKLTNEGAMNIADRCHNLSVLNLDLCELLSQRTLKAVLSSQNQLRELNFGNTVPDTSGPYNPHPILSITNYNLLTKLEIHNCGLDDSSLSLVCSRCVNLSHLDISCNKLTDVSVSQISGLEYIQNLYACHLQNITDRAFLDTVRRGNLRKLRLQSCKNLTDNIMEELAMSCHHLEEVDVAGVPELTSRTLHFFYMYAAHKPGSRIRFYSSDNELSSFCSMAPDFPMPQNLSYMNTYRPLYSVQIVWRCYTPSDENDLRDHNLELHGRRDTRIFAEPAVHSAGVPADFYDSEDEDFLDDFDEFLVNDDPLEAERFDMS